MLQGPPARRTRLRRRGAGWVLLLPLCTGCVPGYVRITVDAPAQTNGAVPLRMLVRAVDPKDFASESYSEVASKITAPDASVLRAEVVYPGTLRTFYLKKPQKGGLGLYFLFTAPGGTWRTLLDSPLPAAVRAQLDGNQIHEESASR